MQEEINYYLDILTYTRKMKEVDLIKKLLFSDDELTIFNFISRPLILSNGKKEAMIFKDFKRESCKINKIYIDKLCEAYREVKSSNSNKKIVGIFKAKVEEIIKDKLNFRNV